MREKAAALVGVLVAIAIFAAVAIGVTRMQVRDGLELDRVRIEMLESSDRASEKTAPLS